MRSSFEPNRYQTLSGLVTFIERNPHTAIIERDVDASYNKTLLSFFRDNEGLEAVEQHLADRGFRRFTLESVGGRALILGTIDDQLIRICCQGYESQRPNLPHVLQPIGEKTEISRYDIEVLPAVILLPGLYQPKVAGKTSSLIDHGVKYDVLHNMEEQLCQVLRDQGYYFADKGARNMGILPDGTPVVIDGGAVVPLKPEVAEQFRNHPRVDITYRWINEEGRSKQQEFFPDAPQGVITLGDLQKSFQHPKSKTFGIVAEIIQESGLYRKDFGAMAERATQRFLEDLNKSDAEPEKMDWREYLIDEHARMEKEGYFRNR